MAIYILKRLCGMVVVLLVMSFIVFCLQSLIPADPARTLAGPSAPQETVDRMRKSMGLDEPLLVQYGHFLERLSRGDLGTSIRTRQPVLHDINKYLPASLELGASALILGLAIACLLAFLQNVLQRSSALKLGILAVGSVPIFLSGLMLVYLLWFKLDWLPGAGRLNVRRFSGPTGFNIVDGLLVGRPDISLDAAAHLVLPALALALPLAVAVGRSLNGALVDVLKQNFIRTARGKGLSEVNVILRHGLRNAASAPLAMIGLQFGVLFGNLLVVERVFAWPGLGLYMVQSFATSDLPAVLGVSLIFGLIYIVISALIEIAQSMADPRIALI
ncbi:ABC transporter permease subunit [Rhizobium sp. CRIBSB]|nr:ABC transporter permease subunit [Rhizobium sp. CRIBSB]